MNIIIIDDDAAFLRSVEILLAGRGHRVAAYTDPDKAVSALAHISGDPTPAIDVLVVDFVLSCGTALDFLEANGRYLDKCKVILVSGHTDLVESLDLERIGVDAFLPKPLDLERLCELIS